MFGEYSDMITIDDLCEMLSIGRGTAYRLLQTHRIKAFKVGSVWKITRAAVEDYVIEQQRSVAPVTAW